MNPDVMMPDAAHPFSMQHSYPQPHFPDASTSGRSNQYDTQQHSLYPQAQATATASGYGSTSEYGQQQQVGNPTVGTGGSTRYPTVHPADNRTDGVGGPPQRQPSQPIFFQGQWFTPAPPGFTPPPAQQFQHGGMPQQQGMPQMQGMPQQQQAQGLQQQQQQLLQQSGYQQPQQPPVHQSYQQPPMQQQQQHSFAHAPHNSAMPSWQSGTATGMYAASTGQFGPSPGLASANTGSQEQAWSPTSAYQFESPTFRNGAAHQLSPGPSGRTWSPAASDVTRLTVPQAEPVPPQQKVRTQPCDVFVLL